MRFSELERAWKGSRGLSSGLLDILILIVSCDSLRILADALWQLLRYIIDYSSSPGRYSSLRAACLVVLFSLLMPDLIIFDLRHSGFEAWSCGSSLCHLNF